MLKKLWSYSGWIVGAYTIYVHIKTLDQLRKEVYSSLSPEQKAKVDDLVGKVKQEIPPVFSSFNQPIFMTEQPAPTIEQVEAGA